MVEVLESSSGSATEIVIVNRPDAGETLVVPIEVGLLVVVEFNPANAGFAVEGDDFVLALEDGARVVFQNLVSAAQGEDTPTIQIAGINIGASLLIDQALAMTGEEAPIETAAGEEDEGTDVADGGGSKYLDSFGDLTAGLIKHGTIGESDLGFALTGRGGMEFQVDVDSLSEGYAAHNYRAMMRCSRFERRIRHETASHRPI